MKSCYCHVPSTLLSETSHRTIEHPGADQTKQNLLMFCSKLTNDSLRQVTGHYFSPHSSPPLLHLPRKNKEDNLKTIKRIEKSFSLFFYYNKYLSVTELNNFKLKPTALLLCFTAAEIKHKSS